MEAKEKAQAVKDREPRVAPGQSLTPAATDVFQRLHASHAARVEKLSMMQELAQQQEAAKLDELKRCTIRTCSSEEEAGQIYRRLYDEAQLRQKRREELAREAEDKETLSSQWSSAVTFSKSKEVPRWEQLYSSAPLKEKRLGEERQRVQQREEQWLAEHCIHRATDAQPETFSRLYRERFDREKRMEQMRAANAASRSQQLAEGSVHAGCSASEADLVERTRLLYEDGLQRMERLEDSATSGNVPMKTLCFLTLALSTGATLLRTRQRHPWFAAKAGQQADDSDCHPKCAWDCGEPECSKSCKAVCQPPKCFTACNKPQEQDCRHVCKDPKCAVVCPAQNCESEHCPPPDCDTVCGEPLCQLECGESHGCETTCDDPVCTFDCKIDAKACAKPECKLSCPKPPQHCNKKYRDLPFAYRLEVDPKEGAAPAPRAANKGPTEVAWKGLAKVPETIGPKALPQAPAPAPAPGA